MAEHGTEPHHPEVAQEPTGTWYHKKLWAHAGILGYSCDGAWYPRTFLSNGQFPNETYDLFKMFKAYENFIQGEQLNNGSFIEVGTELSGIEQILISNTNGAVLRAFGSRNANTISDGKTLLWIDNSTHTWNNVANNPSSIISGSATFTLQGLPEGDYTAQWRDTSSGTITSTEPDQYTVDVSGGVSFYYY